MKYLLTVLLLIVSAAAGGAAVYFGLERQQTSVVAPDQVYPVEAIPATLPPPLAEDEMSPASPYVDLAVRPAELYVDPAQPADDDRAHSDAGESHTRDDRRIPPADFGTPSFAANTQFSAPAVEEDREADGEPEFADVTTGTTDRVVNSTAGADVVADTVEDTTPVVSDPLPAVATPVAAEAPVVANNVDLPQVGPYEAPAPAPASNDFLQAAPATAAPPAVTQGSVEDTRSTPPTTRPSASPELDRYEVPATLRGFDFRGVAAEQPRQVLIQAEVIKADLPKLHQAGVDLAEVFPKGSARWSASPAAVMSSREHWLFHKLLMDSGAATVAANPTLVTVSGRPAHVNVGHQLPIVLPETPQGTSVEYRHVGASLRLVPVANPDGSVRLDARLTYTSQGEDATSTQPPVLNASQIETGVHVAAGNIAWIASYDDQRDHALLVALSPRLIQSGESVDTVAKSMGVTVPSSQTDKLLRPIQLDLPSGGAIELPLKGMATRMSVGHESVVDVTPVAPDRVALQAKEPGEAKVSVWFDDDRLQTIRVTVVGSDTSDVSSPDVSSPAQPIARSPWSDEVLQLQAAFEAARQRVGDHHPEAAELSAQIRAAKAFERSQPGFAEAIKELYPDEDVTARRLATSVILTGEISNVGTLQTILRVGEDYFGVVINNLSVKKLQFGGSTSVARSPESPRDVNDELQELRGDIKSLRDDVQRLIRLLEQKPRGVGSAFRRPATSNIEPGALGQSSTDQDPEDAAVAWNRLGLRLRHSRVPSGVPYSGGLLVTEVRDDGPADEQGIEVGDILVGLGPWETISYENLKFVLSSKHVAEKLKFYIVRGTDTMFGHLELDDAAPPAESTPSSEPTSEQPEDDELSSSIWRMRLQEAVSTALQNSKAAKSSASMKDDNGVLVVARVNDDLSLVDFEQQVHHFVTDVEAAYWDLWLSDQKLQASKQLRDDLRVLWADLQKRWRRTAGARPLSDETAARKAFLHAQTQVETALRDLYASEAKLRYLIGLNAQDGRLLRPADRPTIAKERLDWESLSKEVMVSNHTLRQQQQRLKRRELEVVAAKNQVQPQLDAIAGYRWYGVGGVEEPALGFDLEMPVGQRRQRSSLRHAELSVARERAVLADTETNTLRSLSQTLRDYDFTRESAAVHRNRWQAAQQERLDLQQKYETGQDNLSLVLDAHLRTASARIDHYTQLAAHASTLVRLHAFKGSLLDRHAIRVRSEAE